MEVTVRYLTQVKRAAGCSVERVQLKSPCSARQLIVRLAEQHGGSLRQALLAADGNIQPTLLLFVGNSQVGAREDVRLRDGDELLILAPVAGG